MDEINDCTWIMTDETSDVVESCKRKYEDFGITHYIIDGFIWKNNDKNPFLKPVLLS